MVDYYQVLDNNSEYSTDKFRRATEAYNTLSDPQKRAIYDQQRIFHYESQHYQPQSQSPPSGMNTFFNSPIWGQVRNFAAGMATNMVADLNEQIQNEGIDVDPFVVRNTKLQVRYNSSGSISVTATLTPDALREITAMASRGMDIEAFSSDVGVLFASELAEAIQAQWRGY